jgi:hypothetical protein
MKTKNLIFLIGLSLIVACKKDRTQQVKPVAASQSLSLKAVTAWYSARKDSTGRIDNSVGNDFSLSRLSVDFSTAKSISSPHSNWWLVPLAGQPLFQNLKQGYRRLAFFRDSTNHINLRILEIIPDGNYLQLRGRVTTKDFTGSIFVYDQQYHLLKGLLLSDGKRVGIIQPDHKAQSGLAINANEAPYTETCEWEETSYFDSEGVFTVYDYQLCIESGSGYDDGEGFFQSDPGTDYLGDGNSTATAPAFSNLPYISNPAINPKAYMLCFSSLPDIGSKTTITVYVEKPFPGTSFNIGPNSVGHVAIGLTKSYNGTTITQVVGFYPDATGLSKMVAPSKVNDNGGDMNYDASITYDIIPQNFDQIVNYISSPPASYNLTNFNCTNFVYNACQAGGITLPNPYQPLLFGATQAMTPGALGSSISSLNGMNNVNNIGGTTPNSKGPCN